MPQRFGIRIVLAFLCGTVIVAGLVGAGLSFYREAATAGLLVKAGKHYLSTLDAEQRKTSLLEFDTPKRVDWHFIPKDHRKGLQIKHMQPKQREAAHVLLQSCLSDVGYDKATKIMALEQVLHELEKGKPSGNIRDPERYYVTLFGEPQEDGKWGLSIEGHHLSLNFTIDGQHVVSSTPTFLAANPATIMSEVPGELDKGTRVLANEEQLAFDLLHQLSDKQKSVAILDDTAPREIRAAGEPQPPQTAPEGLPATKMSDEQQRTLKKLIGVYATTLPEDLAAARIKKIENAGFGKVHFAWAGAQKPGVGHYYRIQGPTFLIEFVNTQPDPAGNPANHIHCVWRDTEGDFAIAIKGE